MDDGRAVELARHLYALNVLRERPMFSYRYKQNKVSI